MKIAIIETPTTRTEAEALRAFVRSELPTAILLDGIEALNRWDLCVVLVPYVTGMVDEREQLERLQRVMQRDFPTLLVPRTLVGYAPGRLPAELRGLSELLAVGLDAPDDLRVALRYHLGISVDRGEVRVFISYSWHDGKALADQLRATLEARRITCFQDARDLVPGQEVQPAIVEGITHRDVLLLIDTPRSRASTWVREEIVNARAQRTPFLVTGHAPAVTIEDVGDVAYICCSDPVNDAIIACIEETVRRQHARRVSFAARALRTAKAAGRALGFLAEPLGADGLQLSKASRRVHVEASPDEPRDHTVMDAVSKRAGRFESSCAMLIAGSNAYASVLRQSMSQIERAYRPPVRACPLPLVAASLATLGEIRDGAAAGPKRMPTVFLSAAMPKVAEDDQMAADEMLFAFVSSFVTGLLDGGGRLVFGGHPSITLVVHRLIRQLGRTTSGAISLHQLLRLEDIAPREIREQDVFGEVLWHGRASKTGRDPAAEAADLGTMRDAMAEEADVAVFLGGKRTANYGMGVGLVDELTRFRAKKPGARVHLVGLLGGATEDLIEEHRERDDACLKAHDDRDVDLVVGVILTDLLELGA